MIFGCFLGEKRGADAFFSLKVLSNKRRENYWEEAEAIYEFRIAIQVLSHWLQRRNANNRSQKISSFLAKNFNKNISLIFVPFYFQCGLFAPWREVDPIETHPCSCSFQHTSFLRDEKDPLQLPFWSSSVEISSSCPTHTSSSHQDTLKRSGESPYGLFAGDANVTGWN